MQKSDFYLRALASGLYKRKDWIISAFSLIREEPEAWKKDAFAYRIVQTPAGMFFVDPDDVTKLIKISDAKPGEPIFAKWDHLTVKVGQMPNVTQKDVTTTYGNVLVNYILLVNAFGAKIEFLTGKIKTSQIEAMILPRFKDNPADPSKRNDQDIYVDEYLRFADGAFFLTGFTQLFTPAGSEKSMLAPDGIVELRKKLLKQYEGRLHDPAVIARIDKELVDYDKNVWLKDDEAKDLFAISENKSYNVVRRKLFLQMGAEQNSLNDKVEVDYIERSLSEGWDIAKFPSMNNSLRAGTFGRSAQTMLGGESVKWLLRASSNMAVTMEDCGSSLGNDVVIDDTLEKWLGFSVVTASGHEVITEANHGKYLGREVMLRSPMYCWADKTDFCAVCVGPRLSAVPTALSAAIAEYGSAFLAIFMSAAHGKALLLAKMDYQKAIQ
jgi:hypothetical protein